MLGFVRRYDASGIVDANRGVAQARVAQNGRRERTCPAKAGIGGTELQSAALRILWIGTDGAATPVVDRRLADAPFGPFEVTHCPSLVEASAALGERAFDGVVIDASAAAASQLPAWPGLAQATPDMAVVVRIAGALDAALALRLLQSGVQDVLSLPVATEAAAIDAARSLRLAVERKRIELEARKASATDLRTGLPNRQQLIDHMSQLLALRGREPAPMALLALRIEGFDTIEATLGSESANVLRRKVAVRLRAAVRSSDVVAALTADTFALLLASTEEPVDAELVARKLLQALRQTFSLSGQSAAIAAGIGISQFPADGNDASVLLRQALSSAAAAQISGRDGFVNWRESQWRDTGAANDGEIDPP
jgi:diguanylate cyclase (GGDEF)-like protein